METLRRTGAIFLSIVAAMTLTTPAIAACGLTAESVAKAEVAFVGVLTGVSADGNHATFNVEDTWRGSGPLVGGSVTIDTTNSLQRLELPPPGVTSRYLVLARTVGGQLHTGDGCELFPFPWDEGYAAFRPAGAPPPAESPATDAALPGAVVAAAAALLVLGVVGAVAFRRGSG